MLALPGVSALRNGDFFNEFALALPVGADAFNRAMLKRGIFAGVAIPVALAGHDRGLLVAVTETKTDADLQAYVEHAGACLEEVR